MKDIKKIRELYDLVTEAEEKDTRKLTALVRAGLFDAKKLPALKRALDKSADKMTAQEKRMLINLLDSLMSEVLGSPQVYTKVKQNVQHEKLSEAIKGQGYLSKYDPRGEKGYPKQEDMPAVIVLKRKAIRVYPDNTKVALYYSQALDKYVSIPFGETGVSSMNEETTPTPPTARVGADKQVNMPGAKRIKKKQALSASDEVRSNARKMLTYNRGYDKKKGVMGKAAYLAKSGVSPLTSLAVAMSGSANAQRNRVKNTVARARARTDIKENTITENFASKLQNIREEKQQIDEFAPLIAAAARLAPMAARVASRAAPAIARTASRVGSKLSRAKTKVSRSLRRNAGTLAALSGGSDNNSNKNSSNDSGSEKKFTQGDYNFALKAHTSKANKSDTNKATQQRDTQANRKLMNQPLKEDAFSIIRKTVAENLSEAVVSFGNKQITINNSIANKINNLYESMNKSNKKVMEKMINESASSFNKVLTFSVRY